MLIFDHLARREDHSNGLVKYPRTVLQYHEEFLYRFRGFTRAPIEVVYGVKVKNRMLGWKVLFWLQVGLELNKLPYERLYFSGWLQGTSQLFSFIADAICEVSRPGQSAWNNNKELQLHLILRKALLAFLAPPMPSESKETHSNSRCSLKPLKRAPSAHEANLVSEHFPQGGQTKEVTIYLATRQSQRNWKKWVKERKLRLI
jgi:hypothetical protein